MRQYLQALPLGAEFAIVILGGFGFFFLGAFVMVLTKTGAGDAGSTGVYTSGHLIQLIVYELPVGLALLAFLRLRGWSLERLGVRFSAGETLAGFGLAFVAELACYVPLIAVALAFPASVEAMSAAQATPGGFGLATVIVLCIVNPIFEETFVCGYVITVLKERSDAPTAVMISTAIRLLYHLYQGPLAFFGIVPFGLVVAGWYAGSGRLWPVIVAHAIGDFIALVGYVS
jgi:membrane protease YdiL (CAAX protease family)